MPFLLKLVARDFTRHRSMLAFALLAVMVTCCLIVWFVATIDVASFAEDNGTHGFFGKYTLALCAEKRLPEAVTEAVASCESIEKAIYATQESAQILLDGYDKALKPSGMGDRRSPCVMALSDTEVPFDMASGRWLQQPLECVVGTAAEQLLVQVPGEKATRKVALGDKLNVTTAHGTLQFTVVGKLKQELRKDVRGQNGGMFTFGFGIGIGGRNMGNAPAAPGSGRRTPSGGGRRRNGMFGAAAVSPTTPSIYISPNDMARLFGKELPPNLMFIKLDAKAKEDAFYQDLETACGGTLASLGITPRDTRILAEDKEQVSQEQIIGQAWSTIGIVIIASVFIIFTTLSMGIAAKTRHLAMLRTVGFTRGQIACLVILEGLVLGVLGWLGGMFAGWLLLTVLVYAKTHVIPLVTLSASSVLFAFCCSLFGALLASLLPAWRATRIPPAESMSRNLHALTSKQLFLSGLCGVALLGLIPLVVFALPLATKTRLILFTTVGTACLGAGFLLFIPWTIVLTEKMLGRLLARLMAFHPDFLSQILTGNFWRTLGTTLALSIGLGLFTAIHIWGHSMLNMFWVPASIPDVLVRFQEGVISKETAAQCAAMPGIVHRHFMCVSVAQPNLPPDLQALLRQNAGAMAGNVVAMGMDADTAFRADDPLIRLKFIEGNRQKVYEAFSQKSARVCVIPETLSRHANLHVGDTLPLEYSEIRPQAMRTSEDASGFEAEYVNYKVVGVVDFAWVWLSKCAGVRVSAGRTAALIFTPYEPLLKDFGALNHEFFWFDKEKGVTYAQVTEYMRGIAAQAAKKNPWTSRMRSFAGGTLWDSGINRNFVMVSSNESLNNSLRSRSFSVLDTMAKMPLVILMLSTLAVANTMVVSVRARRWEMGILRSCGVTRGGLLRIILAESILIGLCSCVLSFCFGWFYSWLATNLVDYAPVFGVIAPPMTIPFDKLLPGYALAIATSALAGLAPALFTSLQEPSVLLQRKE